MATIPHRRSRRLPAPNVLATQSPYSYTISARSSPTSRRETELCPPHWRLRPRQSIRSKLKGLLLKEVHIAEATPKHSEPATPRPAMMRMKDSDDYITARAANPRTGLISPSIGSPSPAIPCTPDTPGEALKHKCDEPSSPTPDARSRPALSRANEGRKISAGCLQKWKASADGWMSETMIASPRPTHAHAGARLLVRGPRPMAKDDQFVVHMPSAREPQPFQYPGCTPEQIDAFEHYRQKTSKLTSEERDMRRRTSGRRAVSGGAHGKRMMSAEESHKRWPAHPHHEIDSRMIASHQPGLRVAKRTARKDGNLNDMGADEPCVMGAEVTPANFAPFCSPHTPATRSADTEATLLRTVQPSFDTHHSVPHASTETPILRKPVASAVRQANSLEPGSDKDADLSRLPKVRLIHPEFASLPETSALRHQTTVSPRKCSLGCQRLNDTGECVDRQDSDAEAARRPPALFRGDKPRARNEVGDMLVYAVAGISDFLKDLSLPETAAILLLVSPEASVKEKQAALKTLLPTLGQLFTLLMAITMLWRLGAALLQLLEVLFWPLVVPVKILRWLIGSG